MPLFGSKRQGRVDLLLQKVSMGDYDDRTVRQLQELAESMSDEELKILADALMSNLVKYPDNIPVLTASVKALAALPSMPEARNEFIIALILSLLKAPVNKKDALQRKSLKTEIVKLLLSFVYRDDRYARLMMPELIAAMDDMHGSISTSVCSALRRLAAERPEYFEKHSTALIKHLGSINKSTRAESAKIIGIIGRTHPEYVSKAMPFLQSLASFYPDAHVKRNANEAYQIILKGTRKEPESRVVAKGKAQNGLGLADIMKLKAVPSVGSPKAQFTDDEVREIVEMARREFKNDAEAILSSLGIGHLMVKRKGEPSLKSDGAAKQHPPSCPRCGNATWMEGHLCDRCAGAEFDKNIIL
jgi:ribosomal protein S27AE